MGIFGKKFHGRNNARRFHHGKKTIGIKQKKIIYTHALKNAAPPIVTILALSLSGSLGGAIITEAVFDWPGMGRLYFEAITVMDLPVIIGATYHSHSIFPR